MCYASPGPRCSGHASAELKKKEAQLLAALGTPSALQAFEEKAEAQRQFELTPAGQKELKAKIDQETDSAKKAQLETHLKRAKEARAEAIAAAKATDVGDVQHDATPAKPAKAKLPVAAIPSSEINYRPVTGNVDRYFYHSYSTPDTAARANQAAISDLVDHWSLDYEYTSGPGFYGCTCPDDDYCRCSTIEGVGFSKPLTSEKFAREVFNLGHNATVPEHLSKPFDGFELADHLEPIATSGYYGEEMLGLEMSPQLKKKVEEVTRSLPDAADPQSSYEYARQEGISTKGLTPVEAVKKTVRKRLPADVRKAVNDAKTSTSKQIHLSQIDTSLYKLTDVDPYDYKGEKNRPDLSGGVLVKTGPKQYKLVGGADRFKAVQNLKRAKWSFQVLGD